MTKLDDLAGKRFGKLLVIKFAGKTKSRKILWECECACGNVVIVFAEHLRTGHTTSCGCYRSYATIKSKTIHGQSKKGAITQEYRIWSGMIQRCENQAHPRYSSYGGRGIIICKRWRFGEDGKTGFECFFEDMGPIPDSCYVIDRQNNDGNYEATNCKWITRKESANNTRSNIYFELQGKRQTLTKWADEYKINYHTLFNRLRRGWSLEKALSKSIGLNYVNRSK